MTAINLLEYKSEEMELAQVLMDVSSSSPDEAITPLSPSPPDDHRQYQELLQRVVTEFGIPFKEVQDTQYRLLDIFQLFSPSRMALPVNGHHGTSQGSFDILLCPQPENG